MADNLAERSRQVITGDDGKQMNEAAVKLVETYKYIVSISEPSKHLAQFYRKQ